MLTSGFDPFSDTHHSHVWFFLFYCGWWYTYTRHVLHLLRFPPKKIPYINAGTFCLGSTIWSSYHLLYHVDWREMPFASSHEVVHFVLWAAAYFVMDTILEFDWTFALHHVLAAAAMFTIYAHPPLAGALSVATLIAELGGTAYHISVCSVRTRFEWPALFGFIFVYGFCRTVLMLPWLSYLYYALWRDGLGVPDVYWRVWTVVGGSVVGYQNFTWFLRQLSRFRRVRDQKRQEKLTIGNTVWEIDEKD